MLLTIVFGFIYRRGNYFAEWLVWKKGIIHFFLCSAKKENAMCMSLFQNLVSFEKGFCRKNAISLPINKIVFFCTYI